MVKQLSSAGELENFAENVRRLRKDHKLSVADAAVAAEVNRLTWQRVETAGAKPSCDLMLAMARVLRVRVSELWQDPPPAVEQSKAS